MYTLVYLQIRYGRQGKFPGQFQCHFCPQKFSESKHLLRHVDPLHGMTKFHCPYCPHTSNRKDNLKKHVATKHSESYPEYDAGIQRRKLEKRKTFTGAPAFIDILHVQDNKAI